MDGAEDASRRMRQKMGRMGTEDMEKEAAMP